MPSHSDVMKHEDLPRELQFTEIKNKDFQQGRKEGIENFMLNKFLGVFDDVESFHDFTSFFKYGVSGSLTMSYHELKLCSAQVGDVPTVADRWQSDHEFGRQFLQGTHPTVIRRITKLPENFPVKDQDVRGVLGRGVTLEEALEV